MGNISFPLGNKKQKGYASSSDSLLKENWWALASQQTDGMAPGPTSSTDEI